jgi:predicted anti-sigma-YlaC factor YlaD
MMLTCQDIDHLVVDILDKKLSAASKIGVWFHLLMCPNCRTHVRNTQVLVNSLEQLQQESDPPEELQSVLRHPDKSD